MQNSIISFCYTIRTLWRLKINQNIKQKCLNKHYMLQFLKKIKLNSKLFLDIVHQGIFTTGTSH